MKARRIDVDDLGARVGSYSHDTRARRLRSAGNDADFASNQTVDERGFANIRAPDYSDEAAAKALRHRRCLRPEVSRPSELPLAPRSDDSCPLPLPGPQCPGRCIPRESSACELRP